jgi:hypothetical protein
MIEVREARQKVRDAVEALARLDLSGEPSSADLVGPVFVLCNCAPEFLAGVLDPLMAASALRVLASALARRGLLEAEGR